MLEQNDELVECTANACMDEPNSSFWAELKEICHGNIGKFIIADGCTY